jgi:hypothetical protein
MDAIYEQAEAMGAVPFIAKIDIEGAEGLVFSKNTGWFDKTPIAFIELHDWMLPEQGTSLPVLRHLATPGRDVISVFDTLLTIRHGI